MWPFEQSQPKVTATEKRDEIVAAFADALEHSWSVGDVRSSRSLKDHKELIKLVFVNRLRELGRGPAYDITWSAAMCLPDFQEMSDTEEGQLREFSTFLSGPIGAAQVKEHAGEMSSALSLFQSFGQRIARERQDWSRHLAEHGLTVTGSRF